MSGSPFRGDLYATDAARAQAIADVSRARPGGGVGGQGCVDSGAGGRAVAFPTQDVLERGQTLEHELPLGRIAHGPDAPDLALQRAERGADLDAEVLDQPATDAQLVDAVRHDHGRQER